MSIWLNRWYLLVLVFLRDLIFSFCLSLFSPRCSVLPLIPTLIDTQCEHFHSSIGTAKVPIGSWMEAADSVWRSFHLSLPLSWLHSLFLPRSPCSLRAVLKVKVSPGRYWFAPVWVWVRSSAPSIHLAHVFLLFYSFFLFLAPTLWLLRQSLFLLSLFLYPNRSQNEPNWSAVLVYLFVWSVMVS